MKKIAVLVFALLVAGSFQASSAFACSPAPSWPPPATENLAQKDVAFIGTVKSIAQDKSMNGEYRITFEINQSIKGSLPETVTVRTNSSSAACGYDDGYSSFKAGTVWAIYANGNATTGYSTNSLSLNTSYGSVKEAEDALTKLGVLGITSVTAVPTQDLTVGSRGEAVIWLQQRLISQSAGTAVSALATAGATGYFGPLTRAALAEFQSAHGITPAQGYFGTKTRALMSMTVLPTDPEPAPVEATTFTGKIESVDTGCFADGICSVTVDGKEVIVLAGMRAGAPPVGKLIGVDSIGDFENKIGKTVRVFAAVTTEGGADYTLYGSENYYVELVGNVPANGSITMRGTMECLPHLNTNGMNTLECAFGLKGEDGNHYALRDTDPNYSNVSTATNSPVVVKGTFTAGTNDRYPTVGTIEVTSISKS